MQKVVGSLQSMQQQQNQLIVAQLQAQQQSVFFKSTDHWPLTHQPTNHQPNRQGSIWKTRFYRTSKQLGKCKSILQSIIYFVNKYILERIQNKTFLYVELVIFIFAFTWNI